MLLREHRERRAIVSDLQTGDRRTYRPALPGFGRRAETRCEDVGSRCSEQKKLSPCGNCVPRAGGGVVDGVRSDALELPRVVCRLDADPAMRAGAIRVV